MLIATVAASAAEPIAPGALEEEWRAGSELLLDQLRKLWNVLAKIKPEIVPKAQNDVCAFGGGKNLFQVPYRVGLRVRKAQSNERPSMQFICFIRKGSEVIGPFNWVKDESGRHSSSYLHDGVLLLL
jgi:hypothetical protein